MSEYKTDRSFEIGPIRPPSEASSLLLQITQGCTWNKCRFCTVYRGSTFHVIKPDDVKKNIDSMAYFRDIISDAASSDGRIVKEKLYAHIEKFTQSELECFYMVYNWLASGGESVFLQDGNSIALKPEKLADILIYLREKFPHIKRVTTYGRAETLSRWSLEQWKLLRESGLDRIHSGFESGSDNVLRMINKGLTQEQQIDGGRKIKEAGMELSVYFMPGIGGKEFTEENAHDTAYVVNQINPDFVRLRTFVLKLESEMLGMLQSGEFTELSDIEKLREIRDLVAFIETTQTHVVSDHIVNLVGSLAHPISEKETMLATIDEILNLPQHEQRMYQLARRYGMVEEYKHMSAVSPSQRSRFESIIEKNPQPEQWESYLNAILRRYV